MSAPVKNRINEDALISIQGSARWPSVAGAAAPATATTTAAGNPTGWRGRSAHGGSENGKLDRCFLAGTLGAGDFLLLVDDDFFKVFVALFADIFVDRHEVTLEVVTSRV